MRVNLWLCGCVALLHLLSVTEGFNLRKAPKQIMLYKTLSMIRELSSYYSTLYLRDSKVPYSMIEFQSSSSSRIKKKKSTPTSYTLRPSKRAKSITLWKKLRKNEKPSQFVREQPLGGLPATIMLLALTQILCEMQLDIDVKGHAATRFNMEHDPLYRETIENVVTTGKYVFYFVREEEQGVIDAPRFFLIPDVHTTCYEQRLHIIPNKDYKQLQNGHAGDEFYKHMLTNCLSPPVWEKVEFYFKNQAVMSPSCRDAIFDLSSPKIFSLMGTTLSEDFNSRLQARLLRSTYRQLLKIVEQTRASVSLFGEEEFFSDAMSLVRTNLMGGDYVKRSSDRHFFSRVMAPFMRQSAMKIFSPLTSLPSENSTPSFGSRKTAASVRASGDAPGDSESSGVVEPSVASDNKKTRGSKDKAHPSKKSVVERVKRARHQSPSLSKSSSGERSIKKRKGLDGKEQTASPISKDSSEDADFVGPNEDESVLNGFYKRYMEPEPASADVLEASEALVTLMNTHLRKQREGADGSNSKSSTEEPVATTTVPTSSRSRFNLRDAPRRRRSSYSSSPGSISLKSTILSSPESPGYVPSYSDISSHSLADFSSDASRARRLTLHKSPSTRQLRNRVPKNSVYSGIYSSSDSTSNARSRPQSPIAKSSPRRPILALPPRIPSSKSAAPVSVEMPELVPASGVVRFLGAASSRTIDGDNSPFLSLSTDFPLSPSPPKTPVLVPSPSTLSLFSSRSQSPGLEDSLLDFSSELYPSPSNPSVVASSLPVLKLSLSDFDFSSSEPHIDNISPALSISTDFDFSPEQSPARVASPTLDISAFSNAPLVVPSFPSQSPTMIVPSPPDSADIMSSSNSPIMLPPVVLSLGPEATPTGDPLYVRIRPPSKIKHKTSPIPEVESLANVRDFEERAPIGTTTTVS